MSPCHKSSSKYRLVAVAAVDRPDRHDEHLERSQGGMRDRIDRLRQERSVGGAEQQRECAASRPLSPRWPTCTRNNSISCVSVRRRKTSPLRGSKSVTFNSAIEGMLFVPSCAGHPRLEARVSIKTWMAGTTLAAVV